MICLQRHTVIDHCPAGGCHNVMISNDGDASDSVTAMACHTVE